MTRPPLGSRAYGAIRKWIRPVTQINESGAQETLIPLASFAEVRIFSCQNRIARHRIASHRTAPRAMSSGISLRVCDPVSDLSLGFRNAEHSCR